MRRVKIAVIGAGPAGIASGVEAKLHGIEPVVILEKAPHLCDTIERLYRPNKRVDAIYRGVEVEAIGNCRFETESREAFLERMKKWVEEYNLEVELNSEVNYIKRLGDVYEITVNNEPKFYAEFVIIAIGIFGQPKKPDYPIPKELKGRVFFEPPSLCPSAGKVLVVGGGDTAAEVASFLCPNCEVYLSYRRPQFFRINPVNLKILEEKVAQGKVKLLMGTDIEKLEADDGKVRVFYRNGSVDTYDFVYYCLGGSTPKGFLKYIGVEFDLEDQPKIDQHFETNLPGVFLAGDIAVPKGTIQLAFNTAYIIIRRIKERVSQR
ncbi:MAG: NAD(P)-binding domain-containing protein [Caldimicrobium sp.]|nr:NAD(P)-binding domain-containing protein [Caldimicrobium sp.]MDW8182542.1 NAD(P)-binding domain-containing protein [Caldimicrobium sp.]